jgi:hypothetical protein
MSNSRSTDNSRPFHEKELKYFGFIAFWSKRVTHIIDELKHIPSNAPTTYHDLLITFINEEYLDGEGKLNHKKREKGSKHDDLTLPSKIIEFKFRSDALRSLAGVLRTRKDIFTRNDYLYFSYFRKWRKKFKTKVIKTRGCIYYLYTIVFNSRIVDLDSKLLLKEVIKEEMEFTKEVAKKSDVDLDDEELYSIGNTINEIKLEEALEEKDKALEEKDKALEEKDKALEEKDKALEEKDKALEEKDKIIKHLQEQLNKK